jgi:fucose permease
MVKDIRRSRLLVFSAIALAVACVLFIFAYKSVVPPQFPGGILLWAPLASGTLVTIMFGLAARYAVRSFRSAQDIRSSGWWVVFTVGGSLLFGLFTAWFALFWWPFWWPFMFVY